MGKSSSQVVGYRYFLGLHFALCYGPVDALRRIVCGERLAWAGKVTDNDTISIDAPNLFGGKKREGGIEGDLDVMMGGPAQTANAYLLDKIDGLMPAFRGILSLVYKGGYIAANNPYVKPWAFMVERILAGWDGGTAWYPDTAPIPLDTNELLYPDLALDASDYRGPPFDVPGYPAADYFLIDGLDPTDVLVISVPGGLTYEAWSRWDSDDDNDGLSWTNGIHITNAEQVTVHYLDVDESAVEPFTGPYYFATAAEAAAYAAAQPPIEIFGSTSYRLHLQDWIVDLNRGGISLRIEKITGFSMNPAHIVYQSLTDPMWGMGYPASQIDEASFLAAADTFYDEGLGLCLIWNQQSSIEDFVQLVLDHAGAVYYADPKTGKFKLKPLRADYDPEALTIYDESNIISLDNFQRVGYGDTVNEITVVYRDHRTGKDASITVQDLANIQAQGGVVSSTRQYPGLPTSLLAARIAERDLIAASTPLAKCRITVNRSAWAEAPGGVIKVSWDKHDLDELIFRVLTINYGTLTQGQLVIELVEDVYGLPASSYSVQEPTTFTEPVTTATPITIQDVFEAPYWDIARTLTPADLAYLDADSAFVMGVAATDNAVALGFEMYARIGAADYVSVDSSATFAPTAVIAGSVDIKRWDTVIEYGSPINLDEVVVGHRAMLGTGRSAEFVEIVAIDTGLGEIEVNRGILDTTPQEHVVGTRIFFNEDDFSTDPTERATSDSVDVKLVAFAGGGETTLASATEMNIEPDQRAYRPYPPGKIRLNSEDHPTEINNDITVTWVHRDRLQQTAAYVDQDEASIGPEAATTYNVRIYVDSDLVETQNAISGTTSTLYTFGDEGLGRVEVEAVRDGIVSWQPQVREFQVIVAPDPDFANVVALLHFNDADGSTTFTDVTGHTFTAVANAQIDTSAFKFGGSSLQCDGTGDYIQCSDHADHELGSGDFTMECWLRFAVLPGSGGYDPLFAKWAAAAGQNSYQLAPFNNAGTRQLVFTWTTDGTAASSVAVNWTPTTGVWYFIQGIRSGTTFKFAVDGAQVGSDQTVSGTFFAGTASLKIGGDGFESLNGSIDEARLTKGVARAIAFPTLPFPNS